MLLTIHRKDGSSQVIKLSPQFFQTEVQGTGKNKRITTPKDKAQMIAGDLCVIGRNTLYSGVELVENEKLIANYGEAVGVPVIIKYSDKQAYKKAKQGFNKFITEKHQFDVKHGLTPNQIWKKHAQKAIIFGSETQSL